MTEAPISSYLAAWDALRHRLARLAGDVLALGDGIEASRAGATTERWAAEAHRIGTELASSLEVIDRLADDAADTAVISVAELAGDDE